MGLLSVSRSSKSVTKIFLLFDYRKRGFLSACAYCKISKKVYSGFLVGCPTGLRPLTILFAHALFSGVAR